MPRKITPNQPLGHGCAGRGTPPASKTTTKASAHLSNAVFSTQTRSHPGNVGQYVVCIVERIYR